MAINSNIIWQHLILIMMMMVSFFWNALLVLNSFLVLLNIHILSCVFIYEAVKFLFHVVFAFSLFQISIRFLSQKLWKNENKLEIWNNYNVIIYYLYFYSFTTFQTCTPTILSQSWQWVFFIYTGSFAKHRMHRWVGFDL